MIAIERAPGAWRGRASVGLVLLLSGCISVRAIEPQPQIVRRSDPVVTETQLVLAARFDQPLALLDDDSQVQLALSETRTCEQTIATEYGGRQVVRHEVDSSDRTT